MSDNPSARWDSGLGWLCDDADCVCQTRVPTRSSAVCVACKATEAQDSASAYDKGRIIVCPNPGGNPFLRSWGVAWRLLLKQNGVERAREILNSHEPRWREGQRIQHEWRRAQAEPAPREKHLQESAS